MPKPPSQRRSPAEGAPRYSPVAGWPPPLAPPKAAQLRSFPQSRTFGCPPESCSQSLGRRRRLRRVRGALPCHEGRAKTLLTPPPVAPSWLANSFHTTSETIVAPLASSLVPPHASTCGLEAGKSTLLPIPPSVDPSSPAATVIVIPSAAADWQAASIAVID